MIKKQVKDEVVFSYKVTKDGKALIYWYGKQVTIMKGNKASKFISQIERADFEEQQLLMARATGNLKHGNERFVRGLGGS